MKNLYTLILLISMTAGNIIAMQQPQANNTQVHQLPPITSASTQRFFQSRVARIQALNTPEARATVQQTAVQQTLAALNLNTPNN